MFHVAWIPVRCQGPQTPTPGGARESKGPRTPVPVPCAATHGHPEARGGTPAVWLQAGGGGWGAGTSASESSLRPWLQPQNWDAKPLGGRALGLHSEPPTQGPLPGLL